MNRVVEPIPPVSVASVPVITVDGPSGVGKGTVGRRLAQARRWHFLDSGALYRVLAFAVQQGAVSQEPRALGQYAAEMPVHFGGDPAQSAVLWEGEDIDRAIRTPVCGQLASELAAIPEVRAGLLARQRAFRQPPGLVADGRDMGTVIFPDAIAKFYLTASVEERARRRYEQLKQQDSHANLQTLIEALAKRDARDMGRQTAPLKPADDAVVIDTTHLDVEAVISRIMDHMALHAAAWLPGAQ